MHSLPLQGIRIIDFTWVGAGPYTTKILADAGAEVIKIESQKRPDVLRYTAPFKEGIKGANRSGYFANRNSSKKSMLLDMSTAQSKEFVKQLVKDAHVVTNSFTAGTMEKWGLGYEQLKEVKEDIIFLSMPMQGTTGPHKGYSGFGAMMNALIGLNHLTGIEDREPIGTGTNYPDHVPNPTHAAFAILTALRHRHLTGEGQYIELAQTESALNVLGVALMEAANNGTSPIRKGNDLDQIVPNNVYRCVGEDEWCAISCETTEQWLRLQALLQNDQLFKIRNIQKINVRVKHREAIDAAISEWTAQLTPQQVMEILQEAQIPAGVVQNAQQLIEEDSHLKARQHFIVLPHEEMGETIYNSAPYKLSETPIQPLSAAPLLGEHTDEICEQILKLTSQQKKQFNQIFQ